MIWDSFCKKEPLPFLNGLYTPFGSPVPGGQKPRWGMEYQLFTFLA